MHKLQRYVIHDINSSSTSVARTRFKRLTSMLLSEKSSETRATCLLQTETRPSETTANEQSGLLRTLAMKAGRLRDNAIDHEPSANGASGQIDGATDGTKPQHSKIHQARERETDSVLAYDGPSERRY